MTKLSLSPRYSGLAHRGALRRASRYDPFGTLSLIMGFVSRLKGQLTGPFLYSEFTSASNWPRLVCLVSTFT
ncbi:hypothetical protein E4343_11035 [Serratia quinivorans]|nr:hypothetical protein E4343_11035 [Serratia quinivorans]